MEEKYSGIVLAGVNFGENDKILMILTEKYGKLPVLAKGVKSVRNRHMPCSQLFAYATFGLRKSGNFYYITDSDLIENFFDIRYDIQRLALATYLCDVVNDVTQEGNNEDEILRLNLNMLYAISKELKSNEMIRATFEIRLASELGFTPNINSCHICGKAHSSEFYFDIIDGIITCPECKNSQAYVSNENLFLEKGLTKPISIISHKIVEAILFITSAKQSRILSFSLEDGNWTSFFDVAEKYLLNHLERGFFSLDFYKSVLT